MLVFVATLLGCFMYTIITALISKDIEQAFSTPAPTPTKPPAKQVVSTSLPLQEIWRKEIGLLFPTTAPNLLISGNYLIVGFADLTGKKVAVFDISTGETIWSSSPVGNLRSIHADEEQVYVGTLLDVQAFDLNTGQPLWTGAKQSNDKHGLLNIYSQNNRVQAYSYDDYVLYELDAATGELLKKN